jgi:hypothetical protein
VQLNQFDMLEKLVTENSPSDPSFNVTFSDPSNLSSQLQNYSVPFFGNDGPTTYLRSGISATIVSCIFFYLAYLSFYSNVTNHRNRAISLILFFEGMLIVSMFSSLAIPPKLEFYRIAKILISPLPFFTFGVIVSQAYFISTFGNKISQIYVRYKLGYLLSLALLLIFMNEAIITDSGFIKGVDVNSRDGGYLFSFQNLTLALWALLIFSTHAFVLATIVAELRTEASESKDESTYYLLAYLCRMGFHLVSASIAVTGLYWSNLDFDLFDIMISSYIFAELIYGLLFCYGIVKGNIFGITQIIKKGFVKVFFTIILFSSFYFAESFSGSYLSNEFGNIAGLLSAGIILTLEKFICQKAYLFIDYFIPDADTFTESENIYMYLYEIASEDGIISGDERRMLELTGAKLGLEREDMLRIEKRSDV